MRHKVRRGKLNRTREHRRALFANMSQSLIEHEQIQTTLPKAKVLRPYIERLITLGKKGGLSHRRLARLLLLGRADAISKLFTTFADRYKDRAGGYTRIVRSGFRTGDSAPLAILEFVDRDISAKGKADKERHQIKIQAEQDATPSSSIVG